MAGTGSNKKVANSLVALSSAAVLAVYSAGYFRTRGAADRFALQAAERRPPPRPANFIPAILPTPVPAAPDATGLTQGTSPPLTSPPKTEAAATSAPTAAPTAAPSPVEKPAPVAAPVSVTQAAAEVKLDAPPAAPAAPTLWKDGKYLGWGTSRHGDIQAAVLIEGGRIASATIAQCWTRYSCDVIEKLPPQVAQRQSADVDYVSGASESAGAFYWAVTEALKQAK